MDDKRQVQNTLNMYSEGVSRFDWDQVISAFASDGDWIVKGTDIRLSGHEEMTHGFPKIVSHFEYVSQVNSPAIIEVDGDNATARSVIQEIGKLKDSNHILTILGGYQDRLGRINGCWRIKQRTFCKTASYRTEILPA